MYLLIKLLKPSNHWLIDWSDIIVKPHFSLFPLLEHLPLWFKSMHSCTIQFKLYCLKADVIHLYCFDKRTIHNLFFPILCSRQVLSFIAGSIRLLAFHSFFTLSTISLFKCFYSYTSSTVVSIFFFLNCTFFIHGKPSWVGIKVVMQF